MGTIGSSGTAHRLARCSGSFIAAALVVVCVAPVSAATPGSHQLQAGAPRGDGSPQSDGAASTVSAGCSVTAPTGSRLIGTSMSDGVRYRRYRVKNKTPLKVGLYYRSALRRHGYQVLGWGAGGGNVGPNAGSGFGLSANHPKCGNLSISAGAGSGRPTDFVVCTGSAEAVFHTCSNSHENPTSSATQDWTQWLTHRSDKRTPQPR